MEFSGGRARAIRKASGLNPTEAAQAVGISRQWLWKIERGEADPAFETALNMAATYRCSLEDFCVVHEDADLATDDNGRGKPTMPTAASAKSTAGMARTGA